MQVATSTAFKRKWSVCSPIDRPDTLASALISCDEERFLNKCFSLDENWLHTSNH